MSDPLEPYWTALGKFLHRYAQCERTLSSVLRVAAGLSHNKSVAVFSGTRVPQAIKFIRRIHEADESTLSPWLEKAFTKLNQLTTARDEILHQGFSLAGDHILVTNKDRNVPRAIFERPFGVEDLLDMERDTCVVHACLNMYWLEARYPKGRVAMRERERLLAQSPWRYTPPQPKQTRQRSPKVAPKH